MLQQVLPNSAITQLNKIYNEFIWDHKRPKRKEKTLMNNFDNAGLKDVDIPSKIASLECSWVKRLFDRNFHEWKIIPYFGKNFKFHGSLDFTEKLCWTGANLLSFDPSVPLTILFLYLWFNKHIKIENNSVYFSDFSNHGINFIGNLENTNGKYKSWDAVKYEYNLTNKGKFWWLQLVRAIPKLWVAGLNMDWNFLSILQFIIIT